MQYQWGTVAVLAVAALLSGCASAPEGASHGAAAPQDNPWTAQSGTGTPSGLGNEARSWRHMTFPGKTATRFTYARKDGRDAIAVLASSSVSMMRHKVRVEPSELRSVRFSWKVPALIAGADVGQRDADDSPVRVMLFFEGDRSRFSAKDAMLSELLRTLSGEEMPYATLMYVWCNKREPGTVITSPRTSRVRSVAVESGERKLGQWLDYERNIRADYERAFGEAPGALIGIAIMSDSDNTRSTAQAWYGPVKLQTP